MHFFLQVLSGLILIVLIFEHFMPYLGLICKAEKTPNFLSKYVLDCMFYVGVVLLLFDFDNLFLKGTG